MDVGLDRVNEVADAEEVPAPNLLLREMGEPDFDEIEPRRARGNEMEVEARMPLQPPLNRGMLMRGVVVDDGMQRRCRPACRRRAR